MTQSNNLLLIVDPQVDFITGALPVPGAKSAIDGLAAYIADNCPVHFSHIVITADAHPFNHCSFVQNGGQWPRHCVHDSIGAAIWQPLMDALYDFDGRVSILHKGCRPDCEEYSIFVNKDAAEQIIAITQSENIDRIYICGLAGDVCVAATLADGRALLGNIFTVLNRFSPSFDGGRKLLESSL